MKGGSTSYTPTRTSCAIGVAAWDGGRWIELSQSYGINLDVNGNYSAVTCAARYNGQVFIGGGFASLARGDTFNQNTVVANGICMWDGSELHPLPNGGLNGGVTAMAVYKGELYVVGNFTATKDGQIPLNRIASFDGAWHAVGGGRVSMPAGCWWPMTEPVRSFTSSTPTAH